MQAFEEFYEEHSKIQQNAARILWNLVTGYFGYNLARDLPETSVRNSAQAAIGCQNNKTPSQFGLSPFTSSLNVLDVGCGTGFVLDSVLDWLRDVIRPTCGKCSKKKHSNPDHWSSIAVLPQAKGASDCSVSTSNLGRLFACRKLSFGDFVGIDNSDRMIDFCANKFKCICNSVGSPLCLDNVPPDIGLDYLCDCDSGNAKDCPLGNNNPNKLPVKYPGLFNSLSFKLSDVTCDPSFFDQVGLVDIIVSNFALHWFSDLRGWLTRVAKAMRPNSYFFASIPLDSSLGQLANISSIGCLPPIKTMAFPSKKELTGHLQSLVSGTLGVSAKLLSLNDISQNFASPIDAIKSLKVCGRLFPNKSGHSVSQMRSFLRLWSSGQDFDVDGSYSVGYNDADSKKPKLTYKVGFFCIHKS